ncbi:hypothetical protein JTB14_034290 [Gonioctena quinquepunctata]|nr:hypothetical protein JTB14_034290 [Gonioctena quinquepunctata]
MKHLRKLNNFNSYLALLSARVHRLEGQKQVQEGLKKYCALIDFIKLFRVYRMALAETQLSCIPLRVSESYKIPRLKLYWCTTGILTD